MPTVLGLDYGTRRIGVASGNLLTCSASELDTVRVINGKTDWPRLDGIVGEWRPDRLVIGIPRDASGVEKGTLPVLVRRFGQQAARRYNVPVDFVDEHLTSAAAQERLRQTLGPGRKFTERRQSRRDRIAAVLILESYFEQNH